MTQMEQFRQDLGCEVLSLSVDFVDGIGWLYMPMGECCDMYAAVRMFQSVCPSIRQIKTMAGLVEDTSYHLTDGQWIASEVCN